MSAALSFAPMNALTHISTPAALLDTPTMARNIARMQQRMNLLGVRFRPHVKTAKSMPVTQAQLQAGAHGITVSTLKEAEEFFAAGCTDILYAVCIAPPKLDQALALIRRGCALQLLVDSVAGAQAVVAKGKAAGLVLPVLIEIDTDGHRSGVAPDDAVLLDIGRTLVQGGALLAGVMTHAGSSYDFATEAELVRIAEQERALCVRAAERLRQAGLPCETVSVGSTPTALSAQHLSGVTEVRAGVYVFFDLVMAGVGVCRLGDIALSVLTTVIGHQPDKGWIICDAGWMAMSRDRGTGQQAVDFGYGAVCAADGAVLDGYQMVGANQEHGIVARADGALPDDVAAKFPLGSMLRILPNHACATGAQFSAYQAIQPDGSVEVWPRFSGW